MTANAVFAVTAAGLGLVFLLLTVLFCTRKERACNLIAGFNSMTESQQARYDRAAIARDYGRLFAVWTAGACLCAAACLLWGWVPFAAGMALLLISAFSRMHLWAENAFKKYLVDKPPEG